MERYHSMAVVSYVFCSSKLETHTNNTFTSGYSPQHALHSRSARNISLPYHCKAKNRHDLAFSHIQSAVLSLLTMNIVLRARSLLIGTRGRRNFQISVALKSCPPSNSVHWKLPPPPQSPCTAI